MPIPVKDSAEDKALWTRAEQIAQELLDEYDGAIASAIDDVFFHKNALANGKAADSDFSERMFAEAQADIPLAELLAERVWLSLHARM